MSSTHTEQFLQDHFLGQVFLHPKKPFAHQVAGWSQTRKVDEFIVFLRAVRLIHLFPKFEPGYFRLDQKDIQLSPFKPLTNQAPETCTMIMKLKKDDNDHCFVYTVYDMNQSLHHCQDYLIPLIVYAYILTGNAAAGNFVFNYSGSRYIQ